MKNRVACAAGIVGMAALGLWVAMRRSRSAAMPSLFQIEVDDDEAADLIARFRPALEEAVAVK